MVGAAIGYGFLWSLYWAFRLLTGKEGMGYGDFKLANTWAPGLDGHRFRACFFCLRCQDSSPLPCFA